MVDLGSTFSVPRQPVPHYRFSRIYWEATRARKLLVQYCVATGKYQFYPRPVSIYNGSTNLEWREVSGEGTVFTYTVAQRPPDLFKGHEPYGIVNVTLDVGVNVIGIIVNCSRERLQIGLRVKPYWHPLPDGTHLLMFQPQE